MKMKPVIMMILMCLLSLPYLAQQPLEMTAKVDGKRTKIGIRDLSVKVTIDGMLSKTRLTCVFNNPFDRQLEGQFLLPLPKGAMVHGYALDINNRMVDASIVEKKKARVVFEKVVRKKIDPALGELVSGNRFKVRIFPLPPRGTRKITISYLTRLTLRNGTLNYSMPLHIKDKVKEFDISIRVIQSRIKPKIKAGHLDTLHFDHWQQGYSAKQSLRDRIPPKELVLSIPQKQENRVRIERDDKGRHYFSIDRFLAVNQHKARRLQPKRIAILWDRSLSRSNIDHAQELQLIETYFKRLQGDRSVELIPFHYRIEGRRTFRIIGGNTEELIKHIKQLQYDGASAIHTALAALPKTCERAFLFSDGIAAFDLEEIRRFPVPIDSFVSGSTANFHFLKYLAMRSGGSVYRIRKDNIEAISKKIGQEPYAFLSATVKSGKVSELYPSNRTAISNPFTIVGQLKSETAEIVLNFGIGKRIIDRVPITLRKTDTRKESGDILKTFWAQKKIDDLMVFPKKNRQKILDAGKRFSIVTPQTSLLVLDSLRQYIEHRILPPKSLPKIRTKYIEQVERAGEKEKKQRENKIEKIVKLWKQRVKWWEKHYKPKTRHDKKIKKGETQRLRTLGYIDGGDSDDETGVEGGVEGGVSANVESRPMMRMAKKKAVSPDRSPRIKISGWNPDTPYLKVLKQAKKNIKTQYLAYLKERKQYRDTPAFYMDCADFFFKQKGMDIGLKVLSNLAEMQVENPQMLRILAYRLQQYRYLNYAALVFRKVLELRPEEPQSLRDLALLYGEQKKYKKAVNLLYRVVSSNWDRFAEIELIALMEMNRFIKLGKIDVKKEFPNIDPRLIRLLDVDIRILLSWDTDASDMDLWVFEPQGEKVYYKHQRSVYGGQISKDFTEGYGPEEYMIRRSQAGKYKIKVNYYGSRASVILGPVTLKVDIFTDFGRKSEKKRSIILRLKKKEEVISVGQVAK